MVIKKKNSKIKERVNENDKKKTKERISRRV